MKIRLFLENLLPHNFLWGSMMKKRCSFAVFMVVVILAFFVYSRYAGFAGNIDVEKAKTDALTERLEQQISMFDGVNAAEVTINTDGSVLIRLETQPEFAFEEQIKEYVQEFVMCMPEDILLMY